MTAAPFRSSGHYHHVSADAYAQRTLLGEDAYEPSTSTSYHHLHHHGQRRPVGFVGTPSSLEYASPLSEASQIHDDAQLLFRPIPFTTTTIENAYHRRREESDGETSGSDAASDDEEDDDEEESETRNPFLDQSDRVLSVPTKSPMMVTSGAPSTASSSSTATSYSRQPSQPMTRSSYASSYNYKRHDAPQPPRYTMPPRVHHHQHKRSPTTFSYPLPSYTAAVPTAVPSPPKRPASTLTTNTTSTPATRKEKEDDRLVVKSTTRPSPFPLGPKPPPRRIVVPRRKSLVGPSPHIVDLAVERFGLKTATLFSSSSSSNDADANSPSTSASSNNNTAASSSASVSGGEEALRRGMGRGRKQPMTALEIERERQWQQWDAERVQRQSLDLSTPITPTPLRACPITGTAPMIVRCSSRGEKEKEKEQTKKEVKKREKELRKLNKQQQQPKQQPKQKKAKWWSVFCCVGNRGHEEEEEEEKEMQRAQEEEEDEEEFEGFEAVEEKKQFGRGAGQRRRMLRRRA